jgi:hypothetical protein
VAAALLSLPPAAAAQPAFVQSAYGSGFSSGATETVVFDASVKAGNLIAIYVAWTSASDTLERVTDSLGNTYALVQNATTLGAHGRAAGAYAKNIVGGRCTITVTFAPGTFAARTLIAREIAGVDTTAPLDASAALAQFDPGIGADAVMSGMMTTSAPGSYIFAATADLGHRSTLEPGSGFTGRESIAAPIGARGADRVQPAAGPAAATFTNRDAPFADFITLVMAFKPLTTPDTVPPEVSVIAPLAGAAVSGTIVVSALASDNSRLAGVQFKVDGIPLGAECTLPPCSTTWNTAPGANVARTLTAEARDAAGNVTLSASTVVTVNNVGGAQATISADRRTEWSQAGVPGGIPARTHVCATLTPGATHAEINAAIAGCTDGVVALAPGTYTLSSGIAFSGRSGVTLRGAGPDRTTLVFTGADACGGVPANVCIRGSSAIWSGNVPPDKIRNWTAGYGKGATHLTLSSAAGIENGTILVLDQLDDAAETGGVIVSDAAAFSIEGGAPGRPNRTQQQYVQVVAINGDEVAVTPGLHMPNWRASQQPQAWWWGNPAATAVLNGLEDLTLDHTSSTETAGVLFSSAYGGWVRNVRSLNARRSHVALQQAARIEVRDSYFYGTKRSASQSYGVESFTTSDDLVVNNIFHRVTTPIMTGPNTGSVFAYNYTVDMHYGIASWMMAGIVGSHDAGTGMNLFEGNVGNQFLMDTYHGGGSLATVFRNRLTGTEPGKSQGNTTPISLWAFNRFNNIVGNVLGTPGYHTVYENSSAGVTGYPDKSIYVLGYSGVGEALIGDVPYDTRVAGTLFRWGNFDYATNQVRWSPAEVPLEMSAPTGQTLPPSLFLTVKPYWWGANAWPPIGPDVTGGQDGSGRALPIPAQLCYDNTPKDASGILLFTAARCYPR